MSKKIYLFISVIFLLFILILQSCKSNNLEATKNYPKIKTHGYVNEQGFSANWKVSIYSEKAENNLIKAKIEYTGNEKTLDRLSIKYFGGKVYTPLEKDSYEPLILEEFSLLKENRFEFTWFDQGGKKRSESINIKIK
ncbi:hypothetical protein V7056_20045 [Bacillus sp. JJ664]